MKQAAGLFILGAMALHASAMAEQQAVSPEIQMPTQTSADLKGEPEWFRKFSFSSDDTVGTGVLLTPAPSDTWGLSWDQGERWSITVDRTLRRDQLLLSPLPREEMSASAMFKLTPRLSFGGEVSVGAESLNTDKLADPAEGEVEAGIRLRSAFRF